MTENETTTRTTDEGLIEAMRAAAPRVHNGTYTVHPGDSSRPHYTLKLWTVRKGKNAGNRVIGLLTGPDNASDYRAVAFWDDERAIAWPFRRYRGAGSRMRVDGYNWQNDGWSTVEKKLGCWVDLATRGESGFWSGEGFRLLASTRCVRCNRRLTTPESIEHGIGPICAGRERRAS